MERWVGKVAVVTGASAGIGRDIAEKLVKQGLQVVGLARRVERVEELARSLAGPGKLHPVKCDVSSEQDVRSAFQWTLDHLGATAILINNAGLARNSSFIEGDPSVWKQVLDTNLWGMAVCAQQAVQQMRTAGIAGHIVNINSVLGHTIVQSYDKSTSINMYTPSKFGLTAYTEIMRQEMRNHGLKIKITSISPGLVDSEFTVDAGLPGFTPAVVKQLPHLSPEDVTDAVLYVLGTKPHVQIHEMIIKPVGEAN